MTTLVRMTEEQAESFRQSHRMPDQLAKQLRKLIWAAIRKDHNLPEGEKYYVNMTDPSRGDYLVVCYKDTRSPVGQAKSHTPYLSVPIEHALPYLMNQFADCKSTLPMHAQDIGCGLMVADGNLYVPAI